MQIVSVRGFVIRHTYRTGVYLGKGAAVRDLPLLFKDLQDAESALADVEQLLRPDWTIQQVDFNVGAGPA